MKTNEMITNMVQFGDCNKDAYVTVFARDEQGVSLVSSDSLLLQRSPMGKTVIFMLKLLRGNIYHE